MSNPIRFTLLGIVIVMFGISGCEGPAGPQGEQGNEGQQGPQGETGPGARTVNLSLEDHVLEAALEPAIIISSPTADTGAYFWAAIMDTTIQQVAVADTEFVLVYANLPGVGFTQLPLNASYQSGRLTDLTDQPENYSFGSQSFFIPTSMDIPAASFGTASTEVWSAVFGPDAGYVQLTFTGDKSELAVRTLVGSSFGLDPDTQYGQELRSSEGARFPLDSDLSTPEREDFLTTDGNGEFIYEASTSQLTSLKDSLSQDLDLASDNWGLFPSGDYMNYSGASLVKNPVERHVQLVSQWSTDSIRITGYMSGSNFGNDLTAYVNTFPLEIRVAIVSGDILENSSDISYKQIEPLIN